MKILFDLFPIILFFAAFKLAGSNPEEANALAVAIGYHADIKQIPILMATAIAIAATFLQIGWVWFRHGKVDAMLWVSLGLIVVFGGATLWLHDPTFIKWKPTVLYWLFAATLLVSDFAFNKNLISVMMKGQVKLPAPVWRRLNLSWALFFSGMGVLNLYVAYNYSESTWVNFKLFGFMGLMLVFIVLQGVMLSKHMEEGESP
ncbi:MAG: septation protein A [Burkholderiales bacterium]|nr:septation protein A [Burkholderiales bacterium]